MAKKKTNTKRQTKSARKQNDLAEKLLAGKRSKFKTKKQAQKAATYILIQNDGRVPQSKKLNHLLKQYHDQRVNILTDRLLKFGVKKKSEAKRLAKCILDLNNGKMPRDNVKLLLLLNECLEGKTKQPEPPKGIPDYIFDNDGIHDYYEIMQLVEEIKNPKILFISPLSRNPVFTRKEYDYYETFDDYIDYINEKIKDQDKKSGEVPTVRFSLVYHKKYGWHIFIDETVPSGFPKTSIPNYSNFKEPKQKQIKKSKDVGKKKNVNQPTIKDHMALLKYEKKLLDDYEMKRERLTGEWLLAVKKNKRQAKRIDLEREQLRDLIMATSRRIEATTKKIYG